MVRRHRMPAWLSLKPQQFAAKVLDVPSREQIDVSLEEQWIVEN